MEYTTKQAVVPITFPAHMDVWAVIDAVGKYMGRANAERDARFEQVMRRREQAAQQGVKSGRTRSR